MMIREPLAASTSKNAAATVRATATPPTHSERTACRAIECWLGGGEASEDCSPRISTPSVVV